MLTLLWFILLTAGGCLMIASSCFRGDPEEYDGIIFAACLHLVAIAFPGSSAMEKIVSSLHAYLNGIEPGLVSLITACVLVMAMVILYIALITTFSAYCGMRLGRYFEERRLAHSHSRGGQTGEASTEHAGHPESIS